MKKLLYIGNMAAPYTVKFCYALERHFDVDFWFYVYMNKSRPEWWKIPLGTRCHVLRNNLISYREKYINLSLLNVLRKANPDILILGGVTIPSNWIAYLWGRKRNKKIILINEFFRNKSGKKRTNKIFTTCVRWLYKDIDAIFGAGDHARDYFVNDVGFDESKVFSTPHPVDLDEHLTHPFRQPKEAYTYLYAHQLIEIYDPLLALDIFGEIVKKYHSSKLLMNANGKLRVDCEKKIEKMNLKKDVTFLEEIVSWNDLHEVYLRSDISISPAKFSNGNGSIIEAMASGMGIVISNRIHLNREMLEECGGGFVCNPTVEDFLCAIDRYVREPELLKIHAERNRKVVKCYSNVAVAENFAKLIHEKVLS